MMKTYVDRRMVEGGNQTDGSFKFTSRVYPYRPRPRPPPLSQLPRPRVRCSRTSFVLFIINLFSFLQFFHFPLLPPPPPTKMNFEEVEGEVQGYFMESQSQNTVVVPQALKDKIRIEISQAHPKMLVMVSSTATGGGGEEVGNGKIEES